MPSSTSSSSGRAPDGPWGRTWLTAVALAALMLTGLELGWRRAGHRPAVVDDPAWWAVQRARVSDGRPDTVALIGSSRMQLDIHTPTLRERLGGAKVVQLAVDGQECAATLRDLALDEDFCGVVIAAVTPDALARDKRTDQQTHLDAYHRGVGLNAALNRRFSVWLQSHLVAMHPRVRLTDVVFGWLGGDGPPEPWYVVTHPDRSRSADYARADFSAQIAERQADLDAGLADRVRPEPNRWLAEARELEPYIQWILDRGGRVVLVRFPTTGPHWRWDQAVYPREQFWDRFAALTAAETLHFRDASALTGFECPDTSHLDRRDAPAFTRALADELSRRGVFAPSRSNARRAASDSEGGDGGPVPGDDGSAPVARRSSH